MCNIHGFYNAIENKNGCPLCRKDNNKQYDTILRAKDRKQIYNSKKWKAVREEALIRDEFMCVICRQKGVDVQAQEVDHIIELSDDISKAFDVNNTQSLCRSCHREKTEKERKKRS